MNLSVAPANGAISFLEIEVATRNFASKTALLEAVRDFRLSQFPFAATMNGQSAKGSSFKPHEFLPFGGGVRRCHGASLALWEMKVVVGTLLRRFAFVSASDEVPVRRNVTTGPRHGVVLDVRRRAPITAERAGGSPGSTHSRAAPRPPTPTS